MPTIILSTFAKRDASPAERAAEIASQRAVANTEQVSRPAQSEKRECRGLLRAHLRGVKLEIVAAFQKLAAKHGGIVWAGSAWIEKQGICSRFWAREKLKELIREGWLQPVQWHKRAAFRVLSHAEWALLTGRCNAGFRQLSCADTASLLRGESNSSSSIPLKERDLHAGRSDSEDQKKQYQNLTSYCTSKPAEFLKKNITAKISATNSTWASYLAEESEKSRSELRRKFAWVCRFLEFEISENDAALDWEFPFALMDSYAENRKELRSGALTRGRFACKVIDTCKRDGILWPPAFTETRDRLRQMERLSEANSTVGAA